MVNVQLTVTAECGFEGTADPEAALAAQIRPQIEALGMSGAIHPIYIRNPRLVAVRIDHRYEEQTAKELYAIAAERDIEGRSHMSKAELVTALSGGPK